MSEFFGWCNVRIWFVEPDDIDADDPLSRVTNVPVVEQSVNGYGELACGGKRFRS